MFLICLDDKEIILVFWEGYGSWNFDYGKKEFV